MPRASRKNDIIQTARCLFNQYGYHATGIDLIIQETGISKKTLYTYFRSKEELIVAVLEFDIRKFDDEFIPKIEQLSQDPKAQILIFFDLLKAWVDEKNFYGCMFISAIGEYAQDDTIREVCQQYKAKYNTYFKHLAQKSGYQNYHQLGEELALLVEGVIVTAQISQTSEAIETAKIIVKQLLEITK